MEFGSFWQAALRKANIRLNIEWHNKIPSIISTIHREAIFLKITSENKNDTKIVNCSYFFSHFLLKMEFRLEIDSNFGEFFPILFAFKCVRTPLNTTLIQSSII